jgi:putative NIF3 family GTP cyclohydrolase 1 type 2
MRTIRVRIIIFTAVASLASQAMAQTITAREVVERIQREVGVPWNEPTVDTFKAGDPATPVTGVAVTMMATLDVLKRAAAAGHNLVITHEPTFFDHQDPTDALVTAKDPVIEAKLRFIRDHSMVVWRFHDYSHRKRPDLIQAGVLRALGWSAYQDRDAPWLVRIPDTTLNAVAAHVAERLGAHDIRVVGNPASRITNVALLPGASGFGAHRRRLAEPDVHLLIAGEAQEWETVEYVDDAIAAGLNKSLILVGHIPSEQPGMEDATAWIRSFVPEVPVVFVPAKDPFWTDRRDAGGPPRRR